MLEQSSQKGMKVRVSRRIYSVSSWVISVCDDKYPCMGQRRRCRLRDKSKPHGEIEATLTMEVETEVEAEELPEVPEVGGGKEALSPNRFILLNHWPPGRAG